MGDAVLSAFVTYVVNKALIEAEEELKLIAGVNKELSKFSQTYETIRAVLEDAEEKQVKNPTVRDWLRNLKDVFYEADDFLDEFAFQALRRKMEGGEQTSQVCGVLSCFGLSHLSFSTKAAHKIKDIRERLDGIAKERETLRLRELTDTGRFEILRRPPTSSLVDESTVFGREKDKENIIKLLLSEDNNNNTTITLSVLPILGLGGLGKSTLAQIIYNDTRVTEHFDLRMWVFVSQNFNNIKLTNAMVEAATKSKFDLTNLNMLQETLAEKLKGKKFFLVLDDVWNENRVVWEQACLPLKTGRSGSKVVVTTRNQRVAEIMGTQPAYPLKRLSEDDCWTLFCRAAFAEDEFADNEKLKAIGKEIVSKLDGVPLAAKTVGSMLFAKYNEDDWQKVLNSEFWELPVNENDIMPPLKLSYQTLPSHLKQCFSYCSIFQKGYAFDKEKLIKIWMAQGFLQQQGEKQMEDVGSENFDDLLGRSFFHKVKGSYNMHDMMHALAQYVSIDECFIAQDGRLQGIPNKVRHLSLTSETLQPISLEALFGFSNLRTLIVLNGFNSNPVQVPTDLFIKLKCLRVLDFSNTFLEELPESISNLLHLRYLDLSATAIAKLPDSICRLWNLQTLRLRDCFSLKGLPNGITSLINLRYLEEDSRLISNVVGIGNLTSLRELPLFKVQKEIGHRITELKDMTELRGRLCILNLENVADAYEAKEAKLSSKRHIQALQLEWTDYGVPDWTDENVLECLQPHDNLKELYIEGYNGARFPSWIGDPIFTCLTQVRLDYCKCINLPPLGQLQFLSHLQVQGLDEIKRVGNEFYGHGSNAGFPSLKALHFEEMQQWSEWSEVKKSHFPCIRELSIIRCPKLKGLPTLSSLSSMNISSCSSLRHLPVNMTRLERLAIQHCENIVVRPESYGLQSLLSLEQLDIENCPNFMSLAKLDEVHLPTSIRKLRISSCIGPENMIFKEIKSLTSLQSLEISDCRNLTSLPEGLHGLPSLENFYVIRCAMVEDFPEESLPKTLQYLSIEGCPTLSECCRKEIALDKHITDHVPNIIIDGQRVTRRKSSVPDQTIE
ncbi:putative disease resistance protein RGA3 [Zingiber officinale]|uniref:Uncharacterized protein n=1 Tax=Zingiber officinale TaxID=94328 RepID=A0A8J5L3K3_ZINOF|nr:putative disease resistance protein RGA3 [Zingiber officinale]XP_042395657.1 putative disease resistance protein RGA3 [Zingiber officinale]XP_042395658.1 putative disease resistance protein RGA3 [Zingiber officinale]KAG6505284.1 hypothetical protein ZIOFF_037639 [Zingiber officinale]